MGASATSAAKKNAKPLSLAMSSDEEAHQGEEHVRVVTHHVTPLKTLNTLKTPMKFYPVMNWLAIPRQASGVLGGVITSSRYSSTIAWHTLQTRTEIVLDGTRHPNFMSAYLDPEAKCRSVTASFRPGLMG
jgi:hypothetical protein